LLTDDLLVLSERDAGFVGHPGPSRIKLFPRMARSVLRSGAAGTPLSSETLKLLIPLGESQTAGAAVPLRAVYVLARPRSPAGGRSRVTIRRLAKRRACVELLRNTFNTSVIDPGRLARQFALATSVAVIVPVSLITYPRSIRLLPAVRKAILADLAR
jgi:hypothetical protein